MGLRSRLLLICLTFYQLLLVQPGLAERPKAENSDSSQTFGSFVDYRPLASQYQNALRPISEPLEKASELQFQNKREEARPLFEKALAAGNSLIPRANRAFLDKLYFLIGYAHEQLGQYSEALRSYERSLSHRPGNILAMFRRAHLLQRQDKCEAALPIYRDVLWNAPRLSAEIHYAMGECLTKTGKGEEAAKQFELSYQANPEYLPAIRQLAHAQTELLEQTADPKKRIELQNALTQTYIAILKRSPKDRDASVSLVSLLLAVSDPLYGAQKLSQAEEIAENFVKASNYKDEVFVRLLFQTKLKRGKIDHAEAILREAEQATPRSEILASCQRQLEMEKQLRAQVKAE